MYFSLDFTTPDSTILYMHYCLRRYNVNRIIFIFCFFLLISSLYSQEGPRQIQPDRVIVVDKQVWPFFNWASFDQDKVVSWNNFQYIPYWDADKVLVLVRRSLKDHTFQTLRFPKYTLSINPKDGHRNTVVGISPEDGRLHLSWDHHCNDLRYTKSKKGFLHNPPGKISLSDFEPAQKLTPKAPQRVTYPLFVNDSKENLYFFYRTGGSGDGNTVFSWYNAKQGKWTVKGTGLFGKKGRYRPWHNSSSRCIYPNDILFDQKDRLHITWVYREVSRTWASNHDMHYAYSDDKGITWKNNKGVTIADLAKKDNIVITDPGIVVHEIPVYSWMMNQCGMTLDSNGQPHVITFHLEKPEKPKKLEHSPPKEIRAKLEYFHYWRTKDGTWHAQLMPVNTPKKVWAKRAHIVCGTDNTLYVYWGTGGGFICNIAEAKDGWNKWKTVYMTEPGFFTGDTTKHDKRLLQEKGILSFTADPPGKDRGFAILDFELKKIFASL
jgi:hypothetical protein